MDNYFDGYDLSFLSGAVAGNLIEDECFINNSKQNELPYDFEPEQNIPTRISIKSSTHKVPPFEQYVYSLLNR